MEEARTDPMKDDLARLKRFANDLSRHGVRQMLQHFAETNRPYIPGALIVDGIVFGLTWYVWGRHGEAMGLPLMGIAVGVFIIGILTASSGSAFGGGGGTSFGGGAAGPHPREFMDSNEEWSQAQRDHRQSVKPTANVLFLASLLPLSVGLALWLLGL